MDFRERHAALMGIAPPPEIKGLDEAKEQLKRLGITNEQIAEAGALIEQGDRSSRLVLAMKFLKDKGIICFKIAKAKPKLRTGVKPSKNRKIKGRHKKRKVSK